MIGAESALYPRTHSAADGPEGKDNAEVEDDGPGTGRADLQVELSIGTAKDRVCLCHSLSLA